MAATVSANATPIYTVLHRFAGKPSDGASANGSLVQDEAGNLYGTASSGGAYDLGTVFRLDPAGNESILTYFDYANGSQPNPGLISKGKHLYATTSGGGYSGVGKIVEINRRGKIDQSYSFCSLPNCMDGAFPMYGVTRDSNGSLYGVAEGGGAYNNGVVFKIDSAGDETVLYNFCPGGGTCSDGAVPSSSGVLRDSLGNLYGEAQYGPNNIDCLGTGQACGVVWKLDASGHETVLHAFAGPPSDAAEGWGTLVMDRSGNLFGVTRLGGSGSSCQFGCGTVFKIDANGNENILHNFTGGRDGGFPYAQALVLDKKGALYGTASLGGAYGFGTVFKILTSGELEVLYSFHGQSDGGTPQSGLLRKNRVLYGEAAVGGDLNCSNNPGGGCGVVFKITP